jgi:hypothetical protein
MFKTQKISKIKIRKDIIEFLDKSCGLVDPKPRKHSCGLIHRNCLVLATSYKDAPRATPLEFFNEGLTIYIFGEPGGKIANIKRNKNVSAAIYEQPLDHSRQQKSLQIFGTAEIISMRNNPKLFKAKARKWNLYGVIDTFMKKKFQDTKTPVIEKGAQSDKLFSSLNLIKITPYHIILRIYNPDISMPKYEWKK